VTVQKRSDGSYYPDPDVEKAALEDFTDPAAETELHFAYQRTLGDLITAMLAGRDLIVDPTSPVDCETVEHAFLQQIGLEIRAINIVLASSLTTDDGPCDAVSETQGLAMLRNLATRIEAGTELASRLRRARWGHPSFGSGESWAPKAKPEAEAAE
jgi:hypothetical protein